MNRRTARGNRVGLTLLGLVLLAAGAFVLLRGLGSRPSLLGSATGPVLGNAVRTYPAGNAWFWPVVGAAAFVLALIALRWLIVQGRTEAIGTFALERNPRRGATQLPASAVTSALEDDLTNSPYVQQADATLAGSTGSPRLALTVTLQTGADPVDAVRRIGESIGRLRSALDGCHVPATVRIRTTSRT